MAKPKITAKLKEKLKSQIYVDSRGQEIERIKKQYGVKETKQLKS